MHYTKKIFSVFLFLVCIFVTTSKAEAFSCTSNGTGGGSFNVASTWTGCNSTTPQTSDSITISTGDTVTLVATTNVTGITINVGGILAANTRGLTDTDGYTNNGSQTGTTSTMTLSGVGSILNGSGTYTPTGVVTVSSGAKTVAASSHLSFDKITVTGVILTNNSTAGLTVVTALAGTGQVMQGVNSILNLGGTSAITTLDASASQNEVHYTSTTANQTIKTPSSSYYHLFVDKSGRVGTLAGAIAVTGNLSVTAGTLADGGFQISGNATGTLSMNASTTLTLGTSGVATNFPTSFTHAHIILNATSTIIYNSDLAQTISNIPTYGILTMSATSAVTKTALGPITVVGLFTNGANNTFADGGFAITLQDGCVMTGIHTGSGKILFTGGPSIHSVSGAGSYGNVELNDSNGVLLSGTTNIGGTLTITSGTWDTDARTTVVTGTTTVSGTLLLSSTTGTKTFGDIVIMNGGTLSFTAAETLTENGNLTINSGGVMNFVAAGLVPIFGNLTVNGTGSITGNTGLWTFQKAGGGTIGGTISSLTIAGNVTFATQYAIAFPLTVNTFTVDAGVSETNTSTITVNGTLAGAGTFMQNSGTILAVHTVTITTLSANATGNIVHYIGGVAGTIKGTTYNNLDINKSSGFTATGNGTVNVTGNLTVTSGTLNFATSTITVTGTTDIYGTITDSSGGLAGGNNVFQGLVTVYPGAVWSGVVGEVCDFHFGNGLVMNGTSFTSSTGIYYFETNNQSITGSSSFTIDNLTITGVTLTNSSTGTLTSRVAISGTGTFKQDIGSTFDVIGTNTVAIFDGSTTPNTVNYTGTSAQTVNAGTYDTLNVSTNTSNAVNLSGDTTVATQLTLGDTKISVGANKITLAVGASYSRGNGYVVGMVGKYFSGSTSFTFPIGDPTNYSPLELSLSAVTNLASIDATASAVDNPDIANSGIDPTKSVNRFWTLTNNGLIFGSYNLTLQFVSGDIDVGVDYPTMSMAKKSAGVWAMVPVVCVLTSCSATNLTSMSEFQIGAQVILPVSSSTSTSSTTNNSSSSSSSSSSVTPASVVAILQKTILAPIATLLTPAATSSPSALFDVLATPLFPNAGSGTLFPVLLIVIFSLGCIVGILLLALRRRRQQRRRRRIVHRKHV